ncbi:MAG: hypothetical protein M1812_001026 [Candelaria pacifica]|nr:MAG: hypothetical protein M1812_001026 [Candelaria pacifica]
MAPPEEPVKKKAGRRLTKKRPLRRVSLDVPERFKDGEDADEDVTAPKGKDVQYMNQSVFSMIAAAGSKTDFHSRFDNDSSEDENEPAGLPIRPQHSDSSKRTEVAKDDTKPRWKLQKQGRDKSEHKVLRSLPKLPYLRTSKERRNQPQSVGDTKPEGSGYLKDGGEEVSPRDAPVMSRMLEAQAQLKLTDPTLEGEKKGHKINEDAICEEPSNALAIRLMEIFDFDEPEEVISG